MGDTEINTSQAECEDRTECWDDSVIILSLETTSSIKGYHYPQLTKQQYDPPEPPKKQKKLSISIRNNLNTSNFIDDFHRNWVNDKNVITDDVEIIVSPFKVCVVNNFVDDKVILTKVRDEFDEIQWNKRSLDLYEFFQSKDLKHVNSYYISCVYEFLKKEVKNWIQCVTGLELTKLSATCSLYSYTDYLLVHDDQQEDRAVAFVLYLAGPSDWDCEGGGALQLYTKDGTGEPLNIVRNIYPHNNQFVFFQVTNDSYHQVEEIVHRDDSRMSINGWFHTKNPLVFNDPVYNIPQTGLFSNDFIKPNVNDFDLETWIDADYLQPETAVSIQQQIEEESEISLYNFFKHDVWQNVLEDLHSTDLQWDKVGPPNRRSYELLSEEKFPQALKQFVNLFFSTQMFDLLKKYTDLDLKAARYELQRWGPQCYSLLSDYDWSSKCELDLILYLGLPEVSVPVVGGRTIYISLDEEIQPALITLDPHENHLNIVYRDTARITKYVSKCSKAQSFFLLICSYSE